MNEANTNNDQIEYTNVEVIIMDFVAKSSQLFYSFMLVAMGEKYTNHLNIFN